MPFIYLGELIIEAFPLLNRSSRVSVSISRIRRLRVSIKRNRRNRKCWQYSGIWDSQVGIRTSSTLLYYKYSPKKVYLQESD